MLHLIWTKDNTGTTSEEDKELKGIRSRLIECYRALYFDPIEEGDPRQQTNRITKNMIECVLPSIVPLHSSDPLFEWQSDERGHPRRTHFTRRAHAYPI